MQSIDTLFRSRRVASRLGSALGILAGSLLSSTSALAYPVDPAKQAVNLPQAPDGTGGDGPYVQLWPHRHGTDAMYLALLRRR